MSLGYYFEGQKVKGQLVADVLNSQHAVTSATWRINTKIFSTCRGGGILWRPPAYSLFYFASKDAFDNFLNKRMCM